MKRTEDLSYSFNFTNNRHLRRRDVLNSSYLNIILFLLLVIISQLNLVNAFNVDTSSIITHRGPAGSMFGFSIAQHKDSNVSWILVGAPKADSRQPGVVRGGVVFRCSVDSSDKCQLVPFDRTGNNLVQNLQIDEKSEQWFGATVKSSGEDGIILACAPRYTWFTSNRKRKDPVGTCFVAKDSFTEFVEYSPCRTTKWGYHRQGSCPNWTWGRCRPCKSKLNYTPRFNSAGRRLFLGAVGSWYWQGQMFMIDSRKAAVNGTRAPFYQFLPPGQIYSQSSVLKPDIRYTSEGPSWDDDSYLGYSVAHGEFTGDEEADVAVGMPRGSNLTGKVVIFKSDLTHHHNITGEQMGAYFGYALCVLDVDGDGLDDIVIGAPMHTDFGDTAMKIETGRVYVVYQNKKHKFKKYESLDGTAHRGRFGLSLTSLGDINRDGIDDFAVGAPYDGLYGRGAVYIFQGTPSGVRRESTQVIQASNLQIPVTTFGFSLSGGRDMDGNGYPDLLVGAYDSDYVAYFRSRPVVRVRSKLTFPSGKQVNLDEKNCTLPDGSPVACMPLNLCMSYDGFGADDAIELNVEYILDYKKPKEPRMLFLNNGSNILNSTIRLQKNLQQCSNTQVYIRPNIRDKLSSLEAELKYSMVERRSRSLSPVIDITGSSLERDSINIRKECGADNVCVPDLRLSVKQSDSSFIMGSTERIWIEVEVENRGEDSFESMLFVEVPPGLSYISVALVDGRKDISILCSPPSAASAHTMRCEIGNPFPAFTKAKYRIQFKPYYGQELKRSYDFRILTNSTNPEREGQRENNMRNISIPITVETNVEVYGSSRPSLVTYNYTDFAGIKKTNESHIGPEVLHTYEVKCSGPSSIEEAEVKIYWPSFTQQGEHFLYLLEQPVVDGPGECEIVGNVNPLGVKIKKHSGYSAHFKETSETVQDGEGRQRNFTHSSEYNTESGSYSSHYSNSTTEIRRTTTNTASGGSTSSSSRANSNTQSGLNGQSTSSQNFNTGRNGNTYTYGKEYEREYVPKYGERGYTGPDTKPTYANTNSISQSERTYYSPSNTQTSNQRNSNVGYGQTQYSERTYTGGENSQNFQGGGSQNYNQRNSNGDYGKVENVERTYSRAPSDIFYEGGQNSERGRGEIRRDFETERTYSRDFEGGRNSGGSGRDYENERVLVRDPSQRGASSSSSFETSKRGGGGSVSRTSSYERTYTQNGRSYEGDTENPPIRTHTVSKTTNGRGHPTASDEYDYDEETHLGRNKREVGKEVECEGGMRCTVIVCKIGPLTSDGRVSFYLRGRLYSDSLQTMLQSGESLNVKSRLVTKVTQLPYNVSPDYLDAKESSLSTSVERAGEISERAPISWWVYLLAIILGLLFLSLLIYLLYKCGFFKRRRPVPSPEGQPLHRTNGYRD